MTVSTHYDDTAVNYHLQYERDLLFDTSRKYPANYFRMQMLLNSFSDSSIKSVIEVGVGEGTPLLGLHQAGMSVSGIDISQEMVSACKKNFESNNANPDGISWGDIEDPTTYQSLHSNGRFDGLLAMGVMPHVKNDVFVLKNMMSLVKPGGKVFIEFRNSLFSLFTFNRFTHDFIVNELLSEVSPKLKEAVSQEVAAKCDMQIPAKRDVTESGAIGYDAILSKYHNPFEVQELFAELKFANIKTLWYHYHPALPKLESTHKELFRKEAINLEHQNKSWKGLFLCSAFVIEAIKPE